MLDLVLPMGAVISSWLLCFLLFAGLGLLALRAAGRAPDSGWLVLDSFWLGWAGAIAALQIWHFAFAVDDVALFLLAVVAAMSLLRERVAFRALLLRLRHERFYLLVYALLTLWFSNRALGMPIAFDTGLRDIQAVMWIDSYAIVPGLGNLFGSLAYNHSVYLYDALLDAGFWSGRAYRVATGLLLMVYVSYATRAALSLWRRRATGAPRWSWIAALTSLPYVMFYTVSHGGITHFLTDTAVDVIGFLTLIYFLDFLQDWRPGAAASDYLILRLAVLIAVGFTVKQTYIVYGAATAAVALGIWLRRGDWRRARARLLRLLLPTAALPILFVLPWMARGVVTSGYIAYPLSLGRVELDWTLPREHMESRQLSLAVSTRWRGLDGQDAQPQDDWLGLWLERALGNIFGAALPVALTLGALCCYVGAKLSQKNRDLAHGSQVWALAPLLCMLAFWFVSYPDLKYIRFILWCLAAVSVLLAVLAWTSLALRARLLAVFGLSALCLAYVVIAIIRSGAGPIAAGPSGGFHDHWLTAHEEIVTDHGLVVNVPPFGSKQCWHTPLPCSFSPDPRLRERVLGDMRHGYRLEEVGAAGQSGG